MEIEREVPQLRTLITIPLSETKPGDCIRFASDDVNDAFNHDLFWMKVDAPELKERVRLINIKDGKQIERDSVHRVIVHKASLKISISD